MSLIQDILLSSENDLARRKQHLPLSELEARVRDAAPTRSLYSALSSGFSLIGEVKAKSPSAGLMNEENVLLAPSVYESSPSVAAISVVTEPKFFGGSLERLREIRSMTTKPLLRKDFIFDEYQIWEARAYGADAILLMASLHVNDENRMRRLFDLARSLELDVLVEIGMADKNSTPDLMAQIVPQEARIWGANSRKFHGTPLKLRTRLSRMLRKELTTSLDRHVELREQIPHGKIAVAESGVTDSEYLKKLGDLHYDAALIGTNFLKHKDSLATVDKFAKVALQIRSKSHTDSPKSPQKQALPRASIQ